jgi:alpha-tubulin suppressor-like RCC1 family protein
MRFVCGVLIATLGAFASAGCNGEIQGGGALSTLPAPTVDSVSPGFGTSLGGDSITVLGSGFQTGAIASIGGIPCANTIYVSSGEVTCITAGGVPAGAEDLYVFNLDGQDGFLAGAFMYVLGPAPDATSVFPVDGSSSGGTDITITGTDFTSSATVTVDGAPCTGVVVTQLVAPAAEITCTTPLAPSGPGAVNVVVTNLDGQSDATPETFTYMSPVLMSVSPALGPTAGGTAITIDGQYFHSTATVEVDGVNCPVTSRTADTQIVCTTPSGSAATVAVRVTNPDADFAEDPVAFTYLNPPAVASVLPDRSKETGGVTITITGTDFVTGATVEVDGTPCTSPTVVDPMTITCDTPAHAVGNSTITVINPDLQEADLSTPFTYYADLAVSQSSVLVDQSGTFDASLLVSGGVPPYSYAITDAVDGTLVTSTYTAPADSTSQDIIQVSDSETPPNQLNIVVSSTRTVQVAAGMHHTCALVEHGTMGSLKCWGYNFYGQLGLGSNTNVGTVANSMGAYLPPIYFGAAGPGTDVEQVVAGQNHTCARFADSTVKCWGRNHTGQLGQDNTSDVGTAAIAVSTLSPIALGMGATSIASGANHVCALLSNSTIKCWGENSFGQLGKNSTTPIGFSTGQMAALTAIAFGIGPTPTQITAGEGHNCALFSDNNVRCWGRNARGQLGRDTTTNLGDTTHPIAGIAAVDLGGATAYSVSAGAFHSCAVIDDGMNPDKLKCWGDNTQGQLGQGDFTHRGTASDVMSSFSPIDFGLAIGAVSASAGGISSNGFTCAWRQDTGAVLPEPSVQLKCWGYNTSGQLGRGNTSSVGDDFTPMMDAIGAIPLAGTYSEPATGSTSLKLAVGGSHACAIILGDVLKCWGYNALGQLGQENTTNRGDNAANPPQQMDDNLPPIKL